MRDCALYFVLAVMCSALGFAQKPETASRSSSLLRVPASARASQNPYRGHQDADKAGAKLFARHCASCHGRNAEGGPKAPTLRSPEVAGAPPGVLFWFITNGDLRRGMPAWSRLPDAQRWQIVTYLQSMTSN